MTFNKIRARKNPLQLTHDNQIPELAVNRSKFSKAGSKGVIDVDKLKSSESRISQPKAVEDQLLNMTGKLNAAAIAGILSFQEVVRISEKDASKQAEER